MMLVTTSRKPGQLTRSVARTLCQVLGGKFLNRGKAGFESVLAEADKLGLKRVLFVWEKNGNPDRLVFFDLEKAAALDSAKDPEDPKNSPWLLPELRISGVVFPRVGFRAQGCSVKTEGPTGKTIGKLFAQAEGPNQMVISENQLNAFNEKRLVLSLKLRTG